MPTILALVCTLAQGADQTREKQEEAKLRALEQDIKALQATLAKRSGERSALAAELMTQELAVAAINLKISGLDAEKAVLDQELAGLDQQRQALEDQRRAQQQRIAREIDAAFRLGRAEPLKLLLNQEHPDQLTRTLKYYRYFVTARSAKIDSYKATIAELAKVEATIAGKQDELADNRLALDAEKAALGQHQQERRKVLAALDRQLGTEQARLAELDTQRKELEAVIARLQEAIQNLAAPASDPFPSLRGKLPWPTTGKVLKGYGSQRAQNLPWKGLLIATAEGSPVTAVHTGRVVFSDYLRGHGLLLIIDHGNNYLSLYAHNQVLLKEIGEWVKSGEKIALAGKSGGLEDSALYFEIRHNGQPQDPKNWLARR
ncbi:MAG: peptidoglycan DD-metalloendopeptidase family protein [Porticoccaceae bacterium]